MTKREKLKELRELLLPEDSIIVLAGRRYFEGTVDEIGKVISEEREKDTVYVKERDNLLILGYTDDEIKVDTVKMSLKEWDNISDERIQYKILVTRTIVSPRNPIT